MSTYSSSNRRIKRIPGGILLAVLLLATTVSMAAYLAACHVHLRIGYPLDDAWIHQTYARNLAVRGEWAFIQGQTSGGSTAPLWTILLAAGYFLGIPHFLWTFLLGGLLLLSLAALMWKGLLTISAGNCARYCWAALLVLFEWHFVWSAVSGMETLLHSVLVLFIALTLIQDKPRWLVMGLLMGLSTWVRPDGLTLLGPVLLTAVLVKGSWKQKGLGILLALLGFLIFFAPYLLFNYALAGKLLPTTFYAKQAEYAGWQAAPIIDRLWESSLRFLAGPAIVLIPGVILQLVHAWQGRKWGQLAMFIWMLGYLGVYIYRLPPYQHGRYFIPAMPIFFLLGLGGMVGFLINKKLQGKIVRLVRFSWEVCLVIVCLGFWVMGISSYQGDVEFIETEMVDTALWVRQNLPEDSLVAAHDIGALGYFDDHPLVDLAGLISPEVIPFLLDEQRLAGYLDEQQVDYLVAFPDWYPSLTADLPPIFSTGADYSLLVGETNMTVYEWSGEDGSR